MNRQAPSGLSFVMYPITWTWLSLEKLSLVLRRWSWPLRHAPQPVCVKAGAGLTSKAWTTNSLQLQMGEPYDYITGFLPTNSTWKWASLGTMPSRKTRLRSSLACVFVQRPSSWASRAHRSPCSCRWTCSQVRRLQLKQQKLSFEEHVGVHVLKEVGVLHFRRTIHSCLFILFLTVRLRWMDSSSNSASLAYQIQQNPIVRLVFRVSDTCRFSSNRCWQQQVAAVC